jgi:hypothetical protein
MDPLGSKNFQGTYLRPGVSSFAPVHFLLKRLMIRHSMAAVEASGALRLPPKTEEYIDIHFREEEWRLYHQVHKSVHAAFVEFATVGAPYCVLHSLTIMSLLVPLRRLCSGGVFTPASLHTDVRLKWHEATVAKAAGAEAGEGSFPPAHDEVRSSAAWRKSPQ